MKFPDDESFDRRNDAAYTLAEALIRFDEQNPGEPESDVVVPYSIWADWIDLAGKAGFTPDTKGTP